MQSGVSGGFSLEKGEKIISCKNLPFFGKLCTARLQKYSTGRYVFVGLNR